MRTVYADTVGGRARYYQENFSGTPPEASWTNPYATYEVAHWNMDSNTVDTIYDVTGNGWTATNVGTVGPQIVIQSTNENGRLEYAARYDGTNAFHALVSTIEVGYTNAAGDSQDSTIMFWARQDASAGNHVIPFGDRFGSGNYLWANDGVRTEVKRMFVKVFAHTNFTSLHHYAIVWNFVTPSLFCAFYVDGVQVGTRLSGQTGPNKLSALGNGYTGTSFTWDGLIDDVRFSTGYIHNAISISTIMSNTPPVLNFPLCNPGGNIEVRP